jgi:small subunit ribosomal protein S2
MTKISMRDLLEAGVHFGHQTRRWNPKMEQYIYGARDGVHIINLGKTLRLFNDATHFVSRVVSHGDQLLFVGTKRQAQGVIEDEATRCSMPFVTHRWLGGMLTNHQTIQKSLERLDTIERSLAEGSVERLSKKEILSFEKERNKLLRNLGGVRNMPKLPGAIFVIDPNRERIAIKEAKRLNIPVIAVCDTNCDPDDANYPIPGNDDAIRAIRLFATAMSDACMTGKEVTKDLVGNFESTFSSEQGEDDTTEGMKKTDTEVDVVRRQRASKKDADEAATVSEDSGPEAEVSTETKAEVSTDVVEELVQEETSEETEEAPVVAEAEVSDGPDIDAAATEALSEDDVKSSEITDEA